MITNRWAQFMSKDVRIYVHHMKPRFGQEIRNNFLSQVCHVYSLYCNPREQIYERVHMVLWLLFCTNMYLKNISILHQNCSKNIPLSNRRGNNTILTRELTQNSTLTQKFTFFTTFFAKKSYLIRAIQSKLVTGINYIYNSI